MAVLNLVSASRFGTQVSGGDTVTRALRLNNSSPCGEISGKNGGSHHKLCHVAAMLGGRWGWGKPMACDQDPGEALRGGQLSWVSRATCFLQGGTCPCPALGLPVSLGHRCPTRQFTLHRDRHLPFLIHLASSTWVASKCYTRNRACPGVGQQVLSWGHHPDGRDRLAGLLACCVHRV